MGKSNPNKLCFLIMAFLAVTFTVLSAVFSEVGSASVTLPDNYTYDSGWICTYDDTVLPLTALPAKLDVAPGVMMTLTNTLPDLLEAGNAIRFRSSNQTIHVYIEDELIYSFSNDHAFLLGDSPGSGWHYVILPLYASGKTIRITLSTDYEVSSGYISSFSMNNIGTLLFADVKANMISIIICFLTFLIGIILIVYRLVSNPYSYAIHGIAYLGAVAMIVSVWSFIELMPVSVFYGKYSVMEFLSCMLLMLVPLPMMVFIKRSYYPKAEKITNLIGILCLVNFCISLPLQFFHVISLTRIVLSSHVIIILTILSILYYSIKDYIQKRNTYSLVLFISIFQLFAFSATDLFHYYKTVYTDFSRGFRIGFFLFIVILALHYFYRMSELVEKGMKASLYKRMAYEDILTKCKNRAFFEKELANAERKINSNSSIIIITFDLNNLKITNDQYGHKAGDDLLCACASVISEAFLPLGPCSRIGGDEFSVIMKNVTKEQVEASISKMKILISDYNKTHDAQLQIAYGYAEWNTENFKNLESVLSHADKLMYQRKSIMKMNTSL